MTLTELAHRVGMTLANGVSLGSSVCLGTGCAEALHGKLVIEAIS